jgi:hypothetical protein
LRPSGQASLAQAHPEAPLLHVTINIPEALHKKLKLAAVESDCTATDIIERLLRKELEGK